MYKEEEYEQTWKTEEYRGYITEIHYEEVDKCYVGQILNIKDFIYFEGDTLEGAMSYSRFVIDDYIDMINTPDEPVTEENKGEN